KASLAPTARAKKIQRSNASCRPAARRSSVRHARNSRAHREKVMSYQNIIVETKGRVGIIRLNRPQQFNALNMALKAELGQAIDAYEADETFIEAYLGNFAGTWDRAARARKPIVAAVAGFALGGGCELAMQCDVVIAADTAKFGQPEIKLGVIPGIGGTQRLTRAIGKAKAMEMILTGRMMDAAEAEKSGLVARVVPAASLMEEAMKVAETIANMSLPSVLAGKEAINRAFEGGLSEGVVFERRIFHALFATQDQKEGMKAFIEKRKPVWKNK